MLGPIKSLEVKNFRSLLDFKLNLPEGIILVYGRNGSGKSSIIYSIQYLLFGRAGNLTKNDLKSLLSDKNPVVACEFVSGISISRGDVLKIKKGEKYTKIRDHKSFQSAVLPYKNCFISVGYVPFLDMTPSERRERLLSVIPELDIIRDASQECVKYSKFFGSCVNKKQESVFTLEGELNSLKLHVKSLTKDIKSLEDKMNKLKEQVKARRNDLSKVKEDGDFDSNELSLLKSKLDELKAKRTMISSDYKELKSLKNEITQVSSVIKMLSEKKQEIISNLENIEKSVSEKKCSWCGSTIYIEQFDKLKAKEEELKHELKRVEAEIESYSKILADKKHEFDKYKGRDFKKEDEDLKKDIRDLEALISSMEEKMMLAEKIKSEVEATERAIDMIANQIKDMKLQLKELRNKEKEGKKKLPILKKQVAIYQQRQEEFSGLYNFCKTSFLDIYFNELCSHLSKIANSIVESEGFSIDILPFKGKIEIQVNGKKVQQLSAGERQRVRIATELAFVSLVSTRDFIFIDELLDSNLDQDGIGFFCSVVENYLKPRFRQVFLVSHIPDVLESLEVDEVIKLEKINGATTRI